MNKISNYDRTSLRMLAKAAELAVEGDKSGAFRLMFASMEQAALESKEGGYPLPSHIGDEQTRDETFLPLFQAVNNFIAKLIGEDHFGDKVECFVYLMKKIGSNCYKVGITNDLAKRKSTLGVGSTSRIILVKQVKLRTRKEAADAEAKILEKLEQFRIKGEWVRCSRSQALDAFNSTIKEMYG